MSDATARPAGPVVPRQPSALQRFAARLVWAAIRTLEATQRFRVEDPHGVVAVARREPVIFAVWHNRLPFSLLMHRRLVRQHAGGHRMAALVSASRDGALLAAILEAFDVQPVRGSTSRRGPQGLLELKSWSDRGLDLAITPDGPRGPRYHVQPGVVALAKVTGRAIVPASLNTRWKVQFKSWDRFQLPLPFGACTIALGPLVPPPLDAEQLETTRAELERQLLAITRD